MDYRERYASLPDDELLRIWSESSGLEEDALNALSIEIRNRRLLDDCSAEKRITEFHEEARRMRQSHENRQTFALIHAIVFGLGALLAILTWVVNALLK